jgi:hypothetical protein
LDATRVEEAIVPLLDGGFDISSSLDSIRASCSSRIRIPAELGFDLNGMNKRFAGCCILLRHRPPLKV